ncbi:RHE_PE00001 family protein [Roseibium aggregatum]|uniref:RHE_PE00001 family protein n=1 Tax=Roseibium aggregatum TaxID=187304 RepID=UPI0025AC551D|nr:RHE_PE00001 family protein [Roseibium aggregatum]WJS05572.1 RHE_PE00001 family protein [Roseibium aggregatum]
MPYEIGKLNFEALLGPITAAEDALARLDERVSRSEVGQGFAERADFFEAVSSMWVAGELVHLEDLVLHDARMDVRAPSHELVVAHRIVRARRRVSRSDPGWAVSRSGIMALAGIAEQEDVAARAAIRGGEGSYMETNERDPLPPELADFDEVLAETSWLVESVPPGSTRSRQPELIVGELVIRDPDWDETERISEWLALDRKVEMLPATLAAAVLWDAWECLEPLQRQYWLGQVLVSDFLRSRGKVQSHLLAFSVGLREMPRERRRARDRSTRLIAFLDALTAAASKGMKDIDRLTLSKRQLERRTVGKRSNSSLPAVIELILSRPIVSAHMVAKAARITPRGALNLVGELGVREMTGRGRYRAWGIF